MWRFLVTMFKLKIALMILLACYVVVTSSGDRSPNFREIGSNILGGIEDISRKGRNALASDDGPSESVDWPELGWDAKSGDQEKDERIDSLATRSKGRRGSTLPEDFRRQLEDEVRRLDVEFITERWQTLEHHALQGDPHGAFGDAALAREASSLATLFQKRDWTVNGRRTKSAQLEHTLNEYAERSQSQR